MSSDYGGGGFDFGGSSKSNVDNYYTYKQTGGGKGSGNGSGANNGGCLPAIIVVGAVLLILYLIGNH